MNEQPPPDAVVDDETGIEALSEADPADAPDIAEKLATSLQRELDGTSGQRDEATEPSS